MSGLVIVLVFLSGYVIFAQRRGINFYDYYLSILFFAAYLVFWFFQKYLIPLGLDEWLSEHAFRAVVTGGDAFSVTMVGLSYIGFKLIHFFLDYRAGKIGKVKPLEFLSWLLFFPSIIAGPMQRFQDWQTQRSEARSVATDAGSGLQRLGIGALMKFGLADTIHGATISEMSHGTLATATLSELASGAVCYSLYLYWDFAGYSHMAIGLGKFFGITLPENFRWPYIARNLADFWTRWHISLSLMLRDYIFYPVSLHLKRLPFSLHHQNMATIIPPVITFLLCGLWHGPTIGFVLFGLTHGVGLGFLAILKRQGKKTTFSRWWGASRVAYVCSALLTFGYVTLSFVFFSLSNEKLMILWGRLV